jgi:hypothetical protein
MASPRDNASMRHVYPNSVGLFMGLRRDDMTRVIVNGEGKDAVHAIETLEQLFGKGNAGPYLDLLGTQGRICLPMGGEISYEGAYPHEWREYQ